MRNRSGLSAQAEGGITASGKRYPGVRYAVYQTERQEILTGRPIRQGQPDPVSFHAVHMAEKAIDRVDNFHTFADRAGECPIALVPIDPLLAGGIIAVL